MWGRFFPSWKLSVLHSNQLFGLLVRKATCIGVWHNLAELFSRKTLNFQPLWFKPVVCFDQTLVKIFIFSIFCAKKVQSTKNNNFVAKFSKKTVFLSLHQNARWKFYSQKGVCSTQMLVKIYNINPKSNITFDECNCKRSSKVGFLCCSVGWPCQWRIEVNRARVNRPCKLWGQVWCWRH